MKDTIIKHIRPIIITAVVALLTLITIVLIHALVNSSTIYILVAPQSSTIHIDNHLVKNGNIKVTPGKHTVTTEKDGFEKQIVEVEAKSGETSNVFVVLNSNSDSTANWYNENQEDAALREKIVGKDYNITSQEYERDFPIITQLPYETMNYTIDYGECEYSDFCIYIDAPAGARDVALRVASQFDSELGRYYYIFSDYTNPFSKYNKREVSSGEKLTSNDTTLVEKNINSVFQNTKYKIKDIQLVDDYIIAAVSYFVGDYNDTNTYRLVFQKENGAFILLNTPELVLTYAKYPDIPQNVLKLVNGL